MKLKLNHGSVRIVEKPKYGYGKKNNDYGQGFYCTESEELAMEWAVSFGKDGFVNKYELEAKGLEILDLSSGEFTVLHWLEILVENRTFDIQSDFGNEALRYLRANFSTDYADKDVIIGYRADDSYFSFAQDFLNNVISLDTLSKAMELGELGKQVVLKSKKAFERIKFVDAIDAKSDIWYPGKERRDRIARESYAEIRRRPWRPGEIYMMKIVEEGIKSDDARIR